MAEREIDRIVRDLLRGDIALEPPRTVVEPAAELPAIMSEAELRNQQDLLDTAVTLEPPRDVPVRNTQQRVRGTPGPFFYEDASPYNRPPETDLTAIINKYMANNGSLLTGPGPREQQGPLSGNSLAANSITDGVRAHRGLLTILGEKLGFEGNDWSGRFRGALSLDEPAVERMRQIAANLSRVQPRFTDTALSEWARASNITTDRQIAGATAAAEAGLKSGELSVKAYEAETARIEAGENKWETGKGDLIRDYETWGSAIEQLRSLQSFVVGHAGEFTGGGTAAIGRGFGKLFTAVTGADPGPSEEKDYDRMKASLVATLNSLEGKPIWSRRMGKQTVKQIINKVFPSRGLITRDTEVLAALDGMLEMANRERATASNMLNYFGMGDYISLAAGADARRRNPGGLVSVVLDNPDAAP